MPMTILNTSHIPINPQMCKQEPYQIFFLPMEDVNNPQSFVAFCPFTQIYAEGGTILEATRNWIFEAKERLTGSFSVPKYVYTTQKVWYGVQNGTDIPVYILTFNFSDMAVAFCPKTKQVLIGRLDDWKGIHMDQTEFIPSLWMDWKVTCTPLLESYSSNSQLTTLTPHYIN